MGIFSKIFGGGKLELTDDSQDESKKQVSGTNENQEPSPFLVDDDDEVKNQEKTEESSQ